MESVAELRSTPYAFGWLSALGWLCNYSAGKSVYSI